MTSKGENFLSCFKVPDFESASTDVLNLLYQTIEQAKTAHDATNASVREAKRDFDLS